MTNDEIVAQTLKEHRAMRAALVKVVGADTKEELGELQRCMPLLRECMVLGNDLCAAVDVLVDVPQR